MSNPAISVVIPTYNRAEKLERALKSVLAQSFQDFEIIVVDNASTDETAGKVGAMNDPRIRYVRHEFNRGGPSARNTGIKESCGEYVALLDDDDEWMSSKLEKQLNAFSVSAQAGLIYAGCEIYNETRKAVEERHLPKYKGNVYERLLEGTAIGGCSVVLIKKECFGRVGYFDEALTSCQDWDMWLRIAKVYEFAYVPEILTRINAHGAQISTDFAAMIPGRTHMVEKHWDDFQSHPDILIIHLKRLGKLNCINGTWRDAVRWFKKAVALKPPEILKIMAWCILELPYAKFCSPVKNFKRYRPL